ncbi:MAG: leucine--tRNA ligase [Planctomycetes bacterium]|nr:leucine--tRNA ligase [Planctomycetota bacterium]
MSKSYDPQEIEPRWQARWDEQQTFRARNPGDPDFDPDQPKYYVLDMFPYPSGAGLHVGHPEGYTATDILARARRKQGFNVLHPMGWDAFGLPAEQYAIQTGTHPNVSTNANIDNFRRQLKALGFSYDWSRELSTTHPRYVRWTQWIFARLYERGLAYLAEVPVWWCEQLGTVLANEEVIDGRSERGDFPCVRRPLKQWMLRITAYAQRLLDDLDGLDWPESVKTMQREWIGRSEGAEAEFDVVGHEVRIRVFTTRPDTLFGASFMVLAPEHPLVAQITTDAQRQAVADYQAQAAAKSELDRTDLAKEMTGVWTGAYALNPLYPEDDPRARLPVWIADYVIVTYGTGAIMAVPAGDERDARFAGVFGLPIPPIFAADTGDPERDARIRSGAECWSGPADYIHSSNDDLDLAGMDLAAAKQAVTGWLEARGRGAAKVTYRLRDWLFSRQRYWGEPFPVLHCEDGSIELVPDDQLPVELPAMSEFAPSGKAEPPLAKATEWLRATDSAGRPARRETNTMPNWAGSCWYYLRFMDPRNETALVAPEVERYWGPVDLYIGGTEHAVLHLLYARFWHKVLFDLGVVSTTEPFQKLYNQGMILSFAYQDARGATVAVDQAEEVADGEFRHKDSGEPLTRVVAKMSKTLKNVVNPDDVIHNFGADTLRLYEMYMGPLADPKPWNTKDVAGVHRFLNRVWRLVVPKEEGVDLRPNLRTEQAADPALERLLHRTVHKVTGDIDKLAFNTAIAAMIVWVNEATKAQDALSRSQIARFLGVLNPFAPHLTEELWSRLGLPGDASLAVWPEVDPAQLVDDDVELVVQVLGKLRGRIVVPNGSADADVLAAAREAVAEHLTGKTIVKEIVVPGRLVNFVVK